MSTTREQQDVIDRAVEIVHPDHEEGMLLVNAIAGSGKTHLLTELADQVQYASAIYLAYNKSIATEAAGKFPSDVACMTMHAMAYRNTVRPLGLKVGYFGYRTIKERIPFKLKLTVVDVLKEFCLSPFVTFEEFNVVYGFPDDIISLAKHYFEKMYKAEIECTHDFYMKLFHILLQNGSLDFPYTDLLMIDEAGDLSAVTVEIFRILPAKLKIAVGDTHQNIYAFNNTVNAFKVLDGEGELFKLTKSFRVSEAIAERIQDFCDRYLEPGMDFTGTDTADNETGSTAYLSRTNAALVDMMVELNRNNTAYSLVRSPAEIFRLPLALCSMKYQGTVSDPAYRHIQSDYDDWHEDAQIRAGFKTPLAYIATLHDHDVALQAAIRLVMKFGTSLMFDTYKKAKEFQNKKANIWLATAHSVKGLEFDTVVILDGLNDAVAKADANRFARLSEDTENPDPDFVDEYNEEEIQELNLYYVACSRAKKVLSNALYA